MRCALHGMMGLLILAALGCGGARINEEGASSGQGGAGAGTSASSSGGSGGAGASLWSHGYPTQYPAAFVSSVDGVAINPSGASVVTGSFIGALTLGDVTLSSTSEATFVAAFDPAGGMRWAKALSAEMPSSLMHVGIDGEGHIVLATSFTGTIDLGGGPLVSAGGEDIAVAALDADGHLLWSERFGDADDQEVSGLAVTLAGDIVINGTFGGTLDLGTGALASAGGHAARDVYLATLDAAGKAKWATHFVTDVASTGFVDIRSLLAVNDAGEIAVCMTAAGITLGAPWSTPASSLEGAYVARLDASGAPLWGAALASPASAVFAYSLALGASGEVALTGYAAGSIAFGAGSLNPPDAAMSDFVAVLDPSGAPRWSHQVDFGQRVGVNGMAFDTKGNLALVLGFLGSVDLGAGPIGDDTSAQCTAMETYGPGGEPLSGILLGGGASWFEAMAIAPSGSTLLLGGLYWSHADFGQGLLPPPVVSDDWGPYMCVARVAF